MRIIIEAWAQLHWNIYATVQFYTSQLNKLMQQKNFYSCRKAKCCFIETPETESLDEEQLNLTQTQINMTQKEMDAKKRSEDFTFTKQRLKSKNFKFYMYVV